MKRKSFFQEMGHPQVTGLLFKGLRASPCQNDNGRLGIDLADLSEYLDPVHVWHLEVQDRDVRAFAPKHIDPLLAVVRCENLMPLPPYQRVKQITDLCVIIYCEDPSHLS